jgi:4-hydroxy-3-methylbut-2-enyl diphosphate reductase
VIDATCPLVAKVHAEVRRYAGAGHDVFLIGHADHEEVVGTFGEAPDHVLVVEDVAAARTVDVADPSRVAYVMQTTLAVDEAEQIAGALRDRFPTLVAPRSDDICYATSNRQAAVREIARDCDLVLVVGSANSSNSQRLVEVARRSGAAAHLVDSAGDVDLDWLAGAPRVGVTAGASAPPHLVDELVAALRELGRSTVRETTTVTENLTFTLPREVS